MSDTRFSRAFLLLLVGLITIVFLAMIRTFLLSILLAAIASGLLGPVYARFFRLFRGRRALASLTTIVLLIVVVVGPLLGVLGVVTAEALRVSEAVRPWISQHLANRGAMGETLEKLPGYDKLEPYRAEILNKAGELVGSAGQFLITSLSAGTRGTVSFLFQFFIFLYTLFYFLMDGGPLLRRILYYLPLGEEDERRMVDKFTSVTRATLKGTVFIGLAQGSFAGVALWVVGIQGAVFWGTVMVILSIIPGVGTALIWGPAAIFLFATGRIGAGIFLTAFCSLVVGSIDNLVRPRMVGRDVKMHDLLILFGTIGGIILFGVLGFIIGPILAALFTTIWDIYGVVFRDLLPSQGAEREQA